MTIMDQRSGYQLNNILVGKITQQGPITFEEFMDLVLYHPGYGYYNSPSQKIGRAGDYYTSVHVSSLFGQTIARQLVEMGSYLEWDGLVLVEYGAGEGYLAKDILEALLVQLPEQGGKIPYYICERSSYHRKQQQELLQDFASQVHWFEDLSEINAGNSFKGIILSNELVDAFPVHRVKQVEGKLKEIYVGYDNGSFVETLGPLSQERLGEYFPFLSFQLTEGQEAEINLRALNWLENLGKYLNSGFVMTIDYGYEMNELANPRRFDGTVMCYSNHQADGKSLEGVGLKDITSHVNFSALMEYGKKLGFGVTGFTNQMKFLVGLQVGQRLEDPNLSEIEKQKLALALKELLLPDRMGERFQVLIQHKGFDRKPLLAGFKGFT